MPQQPDPLAQVASRSQLPWQQMRITSLFRRTGLRIFFALTISLLFLWQAAAPASGQQPTPTGISALHLSPDSCSELLINGGFEVAELHWSLLSGTSVPPSYSTARVFAGDRSLRLGIIDSANLDASNGIYQDVRLPDSAERFVLSFHHWPVHEDTPGSDVQLLNIYDAATGVRLSQPWSQLSNQQTWNFYQVDLTHFKGRALRIEFGVVNDGSGGRTALYLDDVSLLACEAGATPFVTPSAAPAQPSSTPRPIATTAPTGCVGTEIVKNGGFEEALDSGTNWAVGKNPVAPVLSNESSAGSWSLRLGNPPGNATQNLSSYSSLRQLIVLPAYASTASVRWSHLSRSQDQTTFNPAPGQDRQELILLKSNLTTERILYRSRANMTTWETETVDLTPFLGGSFYLYFNVLNDGNGKRTWMFLDDVQVAVCYLNSTTPAANAATPTPQQGSSSAEHTPAPGPTKAAEAVASPTLPVRGTIIAVGVTTPSSLIQRATQTPARAADAANVSVWQRFRRVSQTAQGQTFIFLLLIILAVIGYLRLRESNRPSP